MKKIIAVILCAMLMACSFAVAEESVSAWHFVIDEFTLNLNGQTVALTPTLEGTVSTDGANIAGEGSVLLNGEKVLTMQGLYSGDEVTVSFDGAQDALTVSGVIARINNRLEATEENALTADDVALYIPLVFSLLDDTSWVNDLIPDLNEAGIDAEIRGERDFAFSYSEEALALNIHIAWEPAEAVDSSVLTAKNIVSVASVSELPENDVVSTVLAAFSKLMDDPSVQQLMEMIESLDAEADAAA